MHITEDLLLSVRLRGDAF